LKALQSWPRRPCLCRPRFGPPPAAAHVPHCQGRNPRASDRSQPFCSTRGWSHDSALQRSGAALGIGLRIGRRLSWLPAPPSVHTPPSPRQGSVRSGGGGGFGPRPPLFPTSRARQELRRPAVGPVLPNPAAPPREPREAIPKPPPLRTWRLPRR